MHFGKMENGKLQRRFVVFLSPTKVPELSFLASSVIPMDDGLILLLLLSETAFALFLFLALSSSYFLFSNNFNCCLTNKDAIDRRLAFEDAAVPDVFGSLLPGSLLGILNALEGSGRCC
jgi:hypothetical protein